MKRVVLAAVIIVFAVGLFALVSRGKENALIDGFTWSVTGKTAPYSFHIANRTNEALTAVVRLEATNSRESKEGTRLRQLGMACVRIRLAPGEEKTVGGIIELAWAGTSGTAVSYYLESATSGHPQEPSEGSLVHP
ncbi:MAG TPA: hypothetical protein PLV33_04130 [Opitutaceae bacterium]|nr:hypothetical protein [Opitutaceae bacterium]HOR24021.1 hypothetical protein [Opitutaceae bacterium]HPK48518.1 hypothetical protein [Opitutaceae bacterium]